MLKTLVVLNFWQSNRNSINYIIHFQLVNLVSIHNKSLWSTYSFFGVEKVIFKVINHEYLTVLHCKEL